MDKIQKIEIYYNPATTKLGGNPGTESALSYRYRKRGGLMQALKFRLKGKHAFFKIPAVNSYYYFTYAPDS